MIYVCVPVHDEAQTAGLVLWKVRQVFTRFAREYHILALDDGSADGTADVLRRYARVLPMTVLSHRERRGYAASVVELLRAALQRTDRPKRDCVILLHADFVHAPDTMEEMVKRIESGADLVVAEERRAAGAVPRGYRWARRWAPRLLAAGAGVRDPVSGFLAVRLAALRPALGRDDAGLVSADAWCANAELVARLAPHARRVETVDTTARYDLRPRASRARPWDRLVAAWRARGVIRAARAGAALVLAALLGAAPARAQGDTVARPESTGALGARAVPFPVGEHLVYQAKYGFFNVGTATMDVAGIDTVRGTPTVHFVFRIVGGALWYHLDQRLESWVGEHDFKSRRYFQDTDERGKRWSHDYEIYPDSGYYREDQVDSTFATVANPLDDAAFLYWIRTVPLEEGKHYEFERYFRPDRNPVIVDVVGHERVSVAGRKWNAIVIRPRIPNGKGIFAEDADAHMWISDDSAHIVLAIQSNFSFGQVTLKLKSYSSPESGDAPRSP